MGCCLEKNLSREVVHSALCVRKNTWLAMGVEDCLLNGGAEEGETEGRKTNEVTLGYVQ